MPTAKGTEGAGGGVGAACGAGDASAVIPARLGDKPRKDPPNVCPQRVKKRAHHDADVCSPDVTGVAREGVAMTSESRCVSIGEGPQPLRQAVADVCALGGWAVGPGGIQVACSPGVSDACCRVGQTPGPGIDVVLPGDEDALLVALEDALAMHRGRVVAVRGSAGGVGTSSIAAALAWRLGGVLVDADPAGPGVHTLLGLEPVYAGGGTGAILAGGARARLPRWGDVAVVRTGGRWCGAGTEPGAGEDGSAGAGCAGEAGVAGNAAASGVAAALAREVDWVVCDVGRGRYPAPDREVCVSRAIPGETARNSVTDGVVRVLVGSRRVGRCPGVVGVPSLRGPARAVAGGWGPRPDASRSFARAIARLAREVRA